MTESPRSRSHGMLGVVLVALAFAAAYLPGLDELGTYGGDERFYTDGALGMIETGDYLAPRFGDGSLRFNKPLSTYWAIAAAFRVGGVSLVASRVPALLAVVLTLVVTGWVALRLFRDPYVAVLAVLLLGLSNPVVRLASRATPDSLLGLATVLALAGAVRVVLEGERGAVGPTLFWAGVGLAAATKGLYALLIVAFGLFGLALVRERGARLRAFLHPAGLLVGALTAAAGLWPLLGEHASEAAEALFGDQMGSRVQPSVWTVAQNLQSYLQAPVRHFLPFSLLPLALVRRQRPFEPGPGRSLAVWAGVWLLLLAVVFSLGNIRRARYIAPIYPLLAIVLAAVLAAGVRGAAAGRLRRAALAVSFLSSAAALLLAPALLVAGFRGLAALACAVGLGAGWLAWRRRGRAPEALLVACAGFFALVAVVQTGVRNAFTSSPAPTIVRELAARGGPHPNLVLALEDVGLAQEVAAQVRLLSSGGQRVEVVEAGASLPTWEGLVGSRELVLGLAPDARHVPLDLPRSAKTPEILAWLLGDGPVPPAPRDPEPLLLAVREPQVARPLD